MAAASRKFGGDLIGKIPWGTHLCCFYETKQDLIDILIPYFTEGLANNELCIWITSPPLEVEEAKKELTKAVALEQYIERGQIEIFSNESLQLYGGKYDAEDILNEWVPKEKEAIKRGFDGVRIAGSIWRLERDIGQSFATYEERINSITSQHRMLTLCTYCLSNCNSSGVLEVIRNHAGTIARRGKIWSLVENADHEKNIESAECLKQENFLADIVRSASLGVAIGSPDGRIILANAAYQKITGYSEEELKSVNWKTTLTPPEWHEYEHMKMEELEERCRPVTYEKEYIRKDCSRIPVELIVHPFFDEQRNLLNFAFVRDITKRKEAEAKTLMQNSILDSINRIFEGALSAQTQEALAGLCLATAKQLTHSKIGFIGEINAQGLQDIVISSPSRNACRIVDQEGHGKPLSVEIRGLNGRVLTDGKGFFTNDPANHPDSTGLPEGHPPLESFLGVPLKQDKRTIGIIAVGNRQGGYSQDDLESLEALAPAIVEVFDRKKVENALSYQSILLSKVDDAVLGMDANLNITFWNNGAEKVFGWKMEEVIGRNSRELLGGKIESSSREKELNKLLSTGRWEGEAQYRRKDGQYIITDVRASTINDPKKKLLGIITIIRDISQRKKMEEELRRSRDELERRVEERTEMVKEQAELIDKATDAIIIRDRENRVTYWSKGAERIYGWMSKEAIGKDVGKLLKNEKPSVLEAISKTKVSGQWSGELTPKTKDGRELIVESRWTLVTDANQKPKSIMTIDTDITDRKNLEAQYLRAQRLESIGTLAGGIAHDFRNILTPIMITLGLIDQHLARKEDHEMIAALQKNLQRGSDLSRQLLTFARGIEGVRTPISISELISEVERTLKETFPRSIYIDTKVDPNLPAVLGDSTQLHQVLINLSINARDAMPFGGTMHIEAENIFIDKQYTMQHPDAKVGSYVLMSVIDEGMGMPPEVLDKLFEPFFTTKKLGEGTGLGLSTARSIIKSHGGFVEVYSEVGKGTKFKIYLPVDETKIDFQENYQGTGLQFGEGQSILVVDDEELVRTTVSAALEGNGYKVLEASDGAEAVGIYVEHKNEIKEVLIDMVMPIMDGEATIKALRKINPQIKIIGMSGLAEDERYRNVYGLVNGFLVKPFTANKLLRSVAESMSD